MHDNRVATLHPIDASTWHRRELFEHYRERLPTYYSITVDIDVTELTAALRAAEYKSYPAQIWALATVVNRYPEFRMALDDAGNPGVWDVVAPSFTVFNPEREIFSNVWAEYSADFGEFHARTAELLQTHRHANTLFPQGFPPPPNLFDISSIPWTTFTSFTLHVSSGWEHFAPIFTIGKFHEQGGRVLMPLAMQIHHAAADGFHSARLIEDLRKLCARPDWLQ